MRRRCDDPFARFGELDDFDIYAADGHYQHAATHDPKPGNNSVSQTICVILSMFRGRSIPAAIIPTATRFPAAGPRIHPPPLASAAW
jgi:hypothetical protein